MDALVLLLIYSVAIVAAAIVGGALPLVGRWNSTQLHLFTAFSAGVFIGAAFLHMIPDAIGSMSVTSALGLVLVGFVVVLLAERVIFYGHREECQEECEHKHLLTGFSAFVGLVVHSIIAGVGLGVAVLIEPELGVIVFLAIMAHESVELFSLSTVFRLAGFERKKTLAYVGALSLMKPLGAWAAVLAIDRMSGIELGVPLALAAGTFLYVGMYDLLPESFHEEKKRFSGFLAVMLGIAVMYAVGLVIG